ncbi:dual specificity protein kinase splA-like isoform X2 [Adelges cooleyi]|uniref:dual specificity protein kinase splA-like isoform X2 n=1 Tax=Adelges cooleyi TaxID=133065 RepID=UPI0021806A6F|nr:dual specificity protein kinase splA-like isoform X2 [Adelges cooleyi]
MVPNRIFVGGLTNGTTEQELRNFFSIYGEVKVVKIVKDKAGALKGFGFITFGSDEEVKKIIDAGPVLIFKDKRINIAPAFEKDNRPNYNDTNITSSQQQAHLMSYSTQVQQYSVPPMATSAQPVLTPVMYTYQNGMAFFNMPVSGNSAITSQPPGQPNSASSESLVPSVYAAAPYGTQNTTSMQGYSGQPIFYPNPVPQVLVQQSYSNLPVSSVCNGTQGSKVLFSMPYDTSYYSGPQMSNMVPGPDMAYPMPIMSPYMPYMVTTSDGSYPYYDPSMENIQLVHPQMYAEQCANSRPPSSDTTVGQAQVITTNQFVSLMSVVRNDEDKPQMYTPESQQLCLTPVISLAEPPPQSVAQPVVSKPATSSPPDPEKNDPSNQLLMTQIQYNIRHPPPNINARPEQKDPANNKQRSDVQAYQGNNNNLSIKNNNDYMKNGPKKYPETRTFYKTGPSPLSHPRHPNGPQMVNSSYANQFYVPNTGYRHRFPKVHYPTVPQVMLNPNYPYPAQGNIRPTNGHQQMFNRGGGGARYNNSNNYQNNKKNYSSYKGNRINRYNTDHADNPEVSSSEDSRADPLAGGDMSAPQVEGMCSDMRSMTIQ